MNPTGSLLLFVRSGFVEGRKWGSPLEGHGFLAVPQPMGLRQFAQVVRTPREVRTAFDGQGVLAIWWRLILSLHGKPVDPGLAPAARRSCVAAGFRFYGHLYAGLGVWVGLAALPCALYANSYVAGVAIMASAFLVLTSGLARRGARYHELMDERSTVLLVAFFTLIATFLCMVLAAISVFAELRGLVAPGPNLAALLLFAAVGVGSYGIEVVYVLSPPEGFRRLQGARPARCSPRPQP